MKATHIQCAVYYSHAKIPLQLNCVPYVHMCMCLRVCVLLCIYVRMLYQYVEYVFVSWWLVCCRRSQLRREGDRRKRTNGRARTRDLRPNADLQPREPRNRSRSFVSSRPCYECAAVVDRFKPAPRDWHLCEDGSGLSRTSLLRRFSR